MRHHGHLLIRINNITDSLFLSTY